MLSLKELMEKQKEIENQINHEKQINKNRLESVKKGQAITFAEFKKQSESQKNNVTQVTQAETQFCNKAVKRIQKKKTQVFTKMGKKITDAFLNKKVLPKPQSKLKQKKDSEDNLNLHSQILKPSSEKIENESPEQSPILKKMNQNSTSGGNLERSKTIIPEKVDKVKLLEKSLTKIKYNQIEDKNEAEEEIDQDLSLGSLIRSPQKEEPNLNTTFKNVSKKQSKEVEIKEENLLLDLYFHTLDNSHVFDKTEKKTMFKRDIPLAQPPSTKSRNKDKRTSFKHQNGRKIPVK
ncbi:unnamed protein product [Moneuplotes crassus]|uniref:Uncharacterized protein n=1 Tax=Euplotes crassus TaxID=5936 RepID=A0AAD1X6Y4_EUPCR|nr:unnamed protein product [Moneuplotes crassus]